MRKLLYTFLVVASCLPLFAQVSSSVVNRVQEEEKRDALNQTRISSQVIPSQTGTTPTTISRMLDADDDWMDDAWESVHGLDPTDPKDAYADADGDAIINLYEFQMDSDPNDGLSPQTTDFSAGDLSDAIDAAQTGIVLRVSEGVYPLNYLDFPSSGIILMIQGGWNANFTEYDPIKYPTIFDGGYFSSVLYISTGNNVSSTIIVDGLQIKRGVRTNYSNWIINHDNSTNFVSFRNCQFYENNGNDAALAIHHWDGGTDRVAIINTSISGNFGSGLKTQTTDGSMAEWRFVNMTVSGNVNGPNNTIYGYGLEGFTLDGATLDIELINSIIWGNEQESLDFGNGITVYAEYSDIDAVVSGFMVNQGNGMINLDPQFVDPAGINYTLSANSPCIDQGIDIGLPYVGSAPDMGGSEYGLVSSVEKGNLAKIGIYPNPSQGQVFVESDEAHIQSIQLFDYTGKAILASIEQNVSMAYLQTNYRGIALLQIHTSKGSITRRIIFD